MLISSTISKTILHHFNAHIWILSTTFKRNGVLCLLRLFFMKIMNHDHGVPTLLEHHVLENWKTELQPKFTVMESSIRDIFTGWWFGTFGLFFHILGIR